MLFAFSMAKRHEDRKPGQRLSRGTDQKRGGKPQGSGRGAGPSRSPRGGRGDAQDRSDGGYGPPRGDRSARPFGKRPVRGGGVRKSGIKVTAKAAREVDDGKVRLNRYLAMAGVCSRRAADELITSGSVEVNGKTITELGFRLDPAVDEVVVDGERVRQEKKVYVLFNKPTGVVCTNARNEQKKRVIDFLPAVKGRLFTVGRLDLDSEGLILLTNDGDFAQRLTHPRYGVPKTYSVLVRGRIGQKEIEKARGGVWLSEGPTQGMQVKVERAGNERSSIKVVLHEGKNREIRRVFAKLDLPVLELKRIRIGELNLHGLKPGDWRFLLAHEIKELLELSAAAAGEAAPAADVADAATRSAWNSGKSTGKKSAPKKTATKKPEPEGGGDDSDVDDGDEW
ncbi:MAG: hypothetical protein RLZZ562_3142 [Planctomycetota bacterium]|jgi:23S rRNA pseudouridine2605 synthase